jgi:hypothetical protein
MLTERKGLYFEQSMGPHHQIKVVYCTGTAGNIGRDKYQERHVKQGRQKAGDGDKLSDIMICQELD